MLETINSVIAAISGVLYQPWFVPLFLVVSGIYFTFRCKFIQIRLFRGCVQGHHGEAGK